MPGREYLIKGIEDKDVQAYLDFQIDLAVLLGADREDARKEQTEAVEFEIALANVFLYIYNLINKIIEAPFLKDYSAARGAS